MQRLNQTQRKLAYQKHLGIWAVKGGQHTGKTTTAMARMSYLLEHVVKKGEHILFISPEEKTIQRVKEYLKTYHSEQNMSLFEEDMQDVALVSTTQALSLQLFTMAKQHTPHQVVTTYPKSIVQEAMAEARKVYPRIKWLKKEYLHLVIQELEWLAANDLKSLSDYQEMARWKLEMKLPKKGNGRKALWLVKEKTEERMIAEKRITSFDRAKRVKALLKAGKVDASYEYLIVDDAEKLTKVELDILYSLFEKRGKEVVFCMNPEQESYTSFLKKGKGFKKAGFDMTGRVRKLDAPKKKVAKKKKQKAELTPLEALILEASKKAAQKAAPPATSPLPWYIETYEFVNHLTGLKTIFQKDSSAGETYIDQVKQEDVQVLPVYSDIAAGQPIEVVDEMSGKFAMPGELLHHRKNSYILHVQGDSMIGAGIDDGDYVVIQAGNVAEHEIAAVYYNGATTLKRIVQEKEHVLLVSENPKYRPIVIEDGDFRVMGKLVGVIKPLMA